MNIKSRWGTNIQDLPQFYYPAEIDSQLPSRDKSVSYRIIKKTIIIMPDSANRVLGNFLYRHLG